MAIVNMCVIVFIPDTDCVERDIRLTDVRYSSPLLGRVEVCLEGEWGSVCICTNEQGCSSSWKQENVNTVCRQIGEKLGVILNISSMYFSYTAGPLIRGQPL